MKHEKAVQAEFERAAAGFAERTRGRFDAMDVVGFARPRPGSSILEVGCGTGNFLSLFASVGGPLLGLDLTAGMLRTAAATHDGLLLVQGDGFNLPFASRSIDLVTSAQALHHIHEPVPFLREMRRVAAAEGRVLVVDQLGPESYEQLAFMNQVEAIRDPSHAVTRPRSAFLILLRAAGLELIDEKVHTDRSRVSNWMWPGEFPEERIAAVREFVEKFGRETGMEFERDGDDWTFARRRIMLLARRAG